MGRQNKLPTDVLQERVDRMKADLNQIADVITKLETDRDADLKVFQQTIDEAKASAAEAQKEKDNTLHDADVLQAKGEALVSSGKKLLREAQEKRDEAEALDLKLQPIRDAELSMREQQKVWAAKLAAIQDGNTRRKRSQLERDIQKLEKRLERKASEPPPAVGVVPVVPQNGGTPKPEPVPEEVTKLREEAPTVAKSVADAEEVNEAPQ